MMPKVCGPEARVCFARTGRRTLKLKQRIEKTVIIPITARTRGLSWT
jgi:hypothetical protein